MLHFGLKPPISLEGFMQLCEGLLSKSDFRTLKTSIQQDIYEQKSAQPTIKKWQEFDGALRNELVKIRASRKRIDPAKYLRQDGSTEGSIGHLALNAHRNPSLLEGERILDMERWHFLDELTVGHYFDIDFLIVYGFKLGILEKWEKIITADRKQLVEQLLRD